MTGRLDLPRTPDYKVIVFTIIKVMVSDKIVYVKSSLRCHKHILLLWIFRDTLWSSRVFQRIKCQSKPIFPLPTLAVTSCSSERTCKLETLGNRIIIRLKDQKSSVEAQNSTSARKVWPIFQSVHGILVIVRFDNCSHETREVTKGQSLRR